MEEETEILEVIDYSKETVSSRQNRTDAHMNSERMSAWTGFKPDDVPALREGSGHGVPLIIFPDSFNSWMIGFVNPFDPTVKHFFCYMCFLFELQII